MKDKLWPGPASPDRYGYNGPIRLMPESNCYPIQFENSVITSKKTEWELKLKMGEEVERNQVSTIRIQAKAENRNPAKPVFVNTDPAWRKYFPRILYPTFNSQNLIWVSFAEKVIKPEGVEAD